MINTILLIILVLIGGSALIRFAIEMFWMLIKLAFWLGILFIAFQAIDTKGTPPSEPQEYHAPSRDTIKEPSTNTLSAELVLF